MSETHFDEYEHYNFDQEKYMHPHSGKQRTKLEAQLHTNQFDPQGHTRKVVTKLQNTEQNHRESQHQNHPGSKPSDKRKDQSAKLEMKA